MVKYAIITAFLCFFLPAKPIAQPNSAFIVWDDWGVPHMYAATDEDLFYCEGWAQMQLHANLILELYGRSRGRSAEYWGKEKLRDDMMVHALGFPELAREWTSAQDPAYKKMVASFVKGMNDYASAHPEIIKETNKMVLPLEAEDVNRHSLFVILSRFVGGSDLSRIRNYKQMGSNTYAVGPSRSASGKAMLVQNPHLPWWGEFLFTEMHLNKPGLNVYGSTLVGLPGIAIGFNENLGWSHTNNTIDNSDLYELELKDGGYLLDGQKQAFQVRKKKIKIRDESGQIAEQEISLATAKQGPVVYMGKEKALAIRMAGTRSSNMGLQWWRMATATSMEEFEKALQMMQVPFFNVMYADKKGNIFYLFNGQVPRRKQGDWNYWNQTIKGGKSADIWTETHPYSDLPKVKNPATGWLQNANDPPWTSTLPTALNRSSFPPYMSPNEMDFRAQRSARMLQEDSSISFEELETYKLSTRLELADRILDDLFAAIDQHGTDIGKEAKRVLDSWDRQAEGSSTGTALFYQWASAMDSDNPAMFAKPWDENNPRTTPDGLSDPQKAVKTLEQVAAKMKEAYGKLDIPWGEVYKIKNGTDYLPGNGSDGSVGSFRVTWIGEQEGKHYNIGGGDSWVGVIEFGEKVKARVLLSYGNASEPGSVHHGDQYKLFSAKTLRDAYFYKADVDAHKQRMDLFRNGKLVEGK